MTIKYTNSHINYKNPIMSRNLGKRRRKDSELSVSSVLSEMTQTSDMSDVSEESQDGIRAIGNQRLNSTSQTALNEMRVIKEARKTPLNKETLRRLRTSSQNAPNLGINNDKRNPNKNTSSKETFRKQLHASSSLNSLTSMHAYRQGEVTFNLNDNCITPHTVLDNFKNQAIRHTGERRATVANIGTAHVSILNESKGTNQISHLHRSATSPCTDMLTEQHQQQQRRDDVSNNRNRCRTCSGSSMQSSHSRAWNGAGDYEVPNNPTNQRAVNTIVHFGGRADVQTSVLKQKDNSVSDYLSNESPGNSPSIDNPSSAYARISPAGARNSLDEEYMCVKKNFKFYKNGFYVLVVLNIIFILINAIGLPYVYAVLRPPINEVPEPTTIPFPTAEALTAQRSYCMDCKVVESMEETFSAEIRKYMTSNGDTECCFNATYEMVRMIFKHVKKNAYVKDSEQTFIEVKAATFRKVEDSGYSGSYRLIWKAKPVAQRRIDLNEDFSAIQIKKTGFYFMYSRVNFRKKTTPPANTNSTEKFTISVGHSIRKIVAEKEIDVLDRISQKCYIERGNVEHSSMLQSFVHLKQNDALDVVLENTEYFDVSNNQNLFGLLYISR